jgi:hypothetical protein
MPEHSGHEITTAIILEMLAVVLIEIRVHESPLYPATMADVFHHVPRLINQGAEPELIYADMQKIAARHGVEEYLEQLTRHCQR